MREKPESMVERVARAIAEGLGDNFDNAFEHKSEWNAERGEKGGRFRDINEPYRYDYIEAAQAAIEAMREPTWEMKKASRLTVDLPLSAKRVTVWGANAWSKMIDAALSEPKP